MEKLKGIGLLLLSGHERPIPVHLSVSLDPAQEGQHKKWYGDCQIADPRDAGSVASQAGYRGEVQLGDGRRAGVRFTGASHDQMSFVGEGPLAVEPPAAPEERCDVLIVEDEMLVARVLERYLSAAGYSTRVCGEGWQALVALGEVRPRVILLDLLLPDLRGWDLLATVRSNPGLKDTPVVVLSAVEEGRGEARFKEHQPDAYLRKPAEVHEVVARVEQFIRREE